MANRYTSIFDAGGFQGGDQTAASAASRKTKVGSQTTGEGGTPLHCWNSAWALPWIVVFWSSIQLAVDLITT